jgi:hypothetical protein
MPPTDEQLARLATMTDASADPQLSNDDLTDLLARNALPDADGRLADDPDWVPTYLMGGAAQDGWLIKAGRVASRVDGGDGSLRLTRSQLHKHCLEMADRYGARRGSSMPLAPVTGARSTALPAFNVNDPYAPGDPWPWPGGSA